MTTPQAICYEKATFLISAEKLSQCPPDCGREVAFAGRSNAGKSSALNTLTGQKKLARTSKTPGRTQLINCFSLNMDTITDNSSHYRLIDLPGYGYAKVPPEVKKRWQRHLEEYLRLRESLKGIVLVMDIRHPLQEFDATFVEWAKSSNMPLHIILTKADKLKRGAVQSSFLAVKKSLVDSANLISVQTFSSLNRTGIDELKQKLNSWLLD